jgi:hypothetical protein
MWYWETMRSMLRMEEVVLRDGATGFYIESERLGSITVPLPEVDAFCAALQAKAAEVRTRSEAGEIREEAPAK